MDKIPEGYKKTEIGLIPEDWMVRSVGEIFKVTRGQVLSVKLVSQVTNSLNRYPVYSSQTVNDGLVGYYDSYLYENAITWTTDGANAGIVNYRRGKFYCTNVCGVLLNSQGFANLFMAHKIGSVSKSYVSYVGNPKLMNNVVDKILVAIPPLEEQIAYSQKMSDIESLIVSTEKLIEKKKMIRQGVMQELLTGKRRLAGFNGEWKRYKLKQISDIKKGSGLSKSKTSTNGKYKCILYGELFTKYQELITSVQRYTNYNEGELSHAGDVLIPASTTTSGVDLSKACALFEKNVLLGGDINILRNSHKLFESRFLAFLITNTCQQEVTKRAKGITIYHLHGSDLAEIEVSIPSYEEQEMIADHLIDFGTEISVLESKLSKHKEIKQGAMQQLLTGKIRLINK